MNLIKTLYKKNLCYAFVIPLLLVTLAPGHTSQAQDEPEPRFGDGIALLTIPNAYLNNALISPSGDYVLFNANHLDMEVYAETGRMVSAQEHSYQYMWDATAFEFGDGLQIIEEYDHIPYGLYEGVYGPTMRFSPDGRYVGLRYNSSLQVATMPDLRLSRTVPTREDSNFYLLYFNRDVAWSLDSQLFVVVDDGYAIIWDIESDFVERVELPEVGPDWSLVQTIGDEWLLAFVPRTLDQPAIRAVCSRMFETCEVYEGGLIVSQDGQFILNSRKVSETEIEYDALSRQDNREYSSDILKIPAGFGIPRGFSPDGHYLWTKLPGDGLYRIWIWPDLKFVSEIPYREADLYWLPESEHLVSIDVADGHTLQLYSAESGILVDQLRLDEYSQIEELSPPELGTIRIHIDAIGNRIVIDLGWALVVVPVVYE